MSSNENIRPQPSGETQEEIEAVLDRLNNENVRYMARVGGLLPWIETFKSDLRALLSARPLALGGQQGEIVAYRQWCVSDKPHQGGWWQLIEKHDGDHAIATGGGKNLRPLYDTTPARAEAQDEGAVKAWDSDVLDTFGGYSQNVLTRTPYVAKTGERVRSQTPLYAHPSPTPAADEDRVRELEAALETIVGDGEPPERGNGNTNDLLAAEFWNIANRALKSTAAKEGEKS